jgi:hypothetical protein
MSGMVDSQTRAPITVSTDGTAGPYVMVPLDQLDALTALLQRHQVSFWVDSDAISLNGMPEIAVINLGRGASVAHIQQLLDEAQ